MTKSTNEFPEGKEAYCPRCYFEDEKVVLRRECLKHLPPKSRGEKMAEKYVVDWPNKQSLTEREIEHGRALSLKPSWDIATLTDIYEREGLMGIQRHFRETLESERTRVDRAIDEVMGLWDKALPMDSENAICWFVNKLRHKLSKLNESDA